MFCNISCLAYFRGMFDIYNWFHNASACNTIHHIDHQMLRKFRSLYKLNPPIYHLCLEIIIVANRSTRRHMYKSFVSLSSCDFCIKSLMLALMLCPLREQKVYLTRYTQVANCRCSIMHECPYAKHFNRVVFIK